MANDAGTAYVDVEPDLKGFGSKLSRGIDPHVDKSAKNVESKVGGAFKGAAVAAGGAFAAIGAASVFKDVIGGASDLNETISKSNTIFGANAAEIEKWAGGAAKSMGQSKQGALDAAATFGNLFVQLGTGSGEAAKMSKEMVGLASDFASFHNADPTDVIESMTAAFRGEYDAVQRYVPTINAAAVEQEALKMGLAKTTKELTAQDKALATQSLLMSGAGAAVGDFAKTADGLANKQRILSAQFQDTKDTIGTALLPVVLTLMSTFLRLGSAIAGPVKTAFSTIADGFQSMVLAFRGAGDVFEGTGFVGAMEQIGLAARTVFDFIRANAVPVLAGLAAAIMVTVVPAFAAWAAAQYAAIAPILAVVAAVGLVVGAVVYAYTHFEAFRSVIDAVASFLVGTVWPKIQQFAGLIADQFGNLVGFVQGHWGAIQEAVGHAVNVVQAIIQNFVAVVQAVWQAWGDELVNIAGIVWDQIRNVIDTVVGIISGVITAGLALINGEWGAAWDAIMGIVDTAGRFIIETIGNALRMAREAVEGGVSAIVGLMGGLPGQILGAIGNLGSLLFSAGADLVRGMINGVKSMVGALADAAKSVVGSAVNAAKSALGISSPSRVFMTIGGQVGEGLVFGLENSEGGIERAFRAILEAIAAMFATKASSTASGFSIGSGNGRDSRAMIHNADGSPTGQYVQDNDDFISNDRNDPDRNKPGYYQHEDGSWGRDSSFPDSNQPRYFNQRAPGVYHTGGIVTGPRGKDVPIVAAGGEGVFTPAQMAAMGNSMDGATIAALAAAFAAELRANPPVVTVSSIAKGLHESRRR